jgi:hypothetical protein
MILTCNLTIPATPPERGESVVVAEIVGGPMPTPTIRLRHRHDPVLEHWWTVEATGQIGETHGTYDQALSFALRAATALLAGIAANAALAARRAHDDARR